MGPIRFYKMSGSGNDFIVVDSRRSRDPRLMDPRHIQVACARGTGIGADGVVLLESEPGVDFRMVYFNADGSRASMCGNAALCCTRLASELGMGGGSELLFETDAGRLRGRMRNGLPEIDLTPVRDVNQAVDIAAVGGEHRMGFADAGVPHLVVLCDDIEQVAIDSRGKELRSHPRVMPKGANANFVSRLDREFAWAMRTFERGVEGETLACGTGAVATAVLLTEWGLSDGPVALRTRSGKVLTVTLRRDGESWRPSLSGEGRIVFEGSSRELFD